MEGDKRISCIRDINGVLFHLFMVCWWTNWFSFVPYRLKPGQSIYFTIPISISFSSHSSPRLVSFVLQTTYENFRYRADGRINVFNRGCLHNFLEVFCTEIKPSRNNFRAFVQEEGQRPLTPVFARGHEQGDLSGDRRPKVEHDLDIGEDLLKISQRRNIEELDEDIRSRGSNGAPHNAADPDSILSSDHRATTIRSDTRHSSWERSGNWEIAQDVFANSSVTESRNHVTSKEMRQ